MTIDFDSATTHGNNGAYSALASDAVSHTGTGSDLGALVVVNLRRTDGWPVHAGNTWCRYGGVDMTLLGRPYLNNNTGGSGGYIGLWALGGQFADVPSGTQTVEINEYLSGLTFMQWNFQVLTYRNVGTFSSVTLGAGTESGTTMGLTLTSEAGSRVFTALGHESTSAITGQNQTVRGDLNLSSYPERVTVMDAPGAASVTFSSSRASGVDYAAIGVNMQSAQGSTGMLGMF